LALHEVSGGLIRQQKNDGSWSSYYATGRSTQPAEYATYVALTFLLNLKEANLPTVDSIPLTRAIQKGLNWILDAYDPSSGGWKDQDNVGVEPDIATLILLVLLKAYGAGFPYVENSLAFRDARTHWLTQAKEYASARSVRRMGI
jgi:hypothetical protein